MSKVNMTSKRTGDELTIEASGRIDTSTAPEFEQYIKKELSGVKKLVVDFKNVEYISSSGLRSLLSIHKTMTSADAEFIIKDPVDIVYEVFEVTGFSDVLNIVR